MKIVRRLSLPVVLLAVLSTTLVACSAAAEASDSSTPPASTPVAPDDPNAGGGGGAGQDPGRQEPGGGAGVDPDKPVGANPPAADPGVPGDGALHVQPQPGVVNALPHAWDHIAVAADGRTLTVYYWGGVEDCYALDRVDVERDADGRLVVQVFEGQRGDLGPDVACIEIALLKAVTVTLDEPLVAPAQ